MVSILIRHKVADYDKWRPLFDEHQETRTEAGEQSFQVFRSKDNPNEVWVILKWESVEKAKEFLENPFLKTKMEEAGVIEVPDINFLEEA